MVKAYVSSSLLVIHHFKNIFKNYKTARVERKISNFLLHKTRDAIHLLFLVKAQVFLLEVCLPVRRAELIHQGFQPLAR